MVGECLREGILELPLHFERFVESDLVIWYNQASSTSEQDVLDVLNGYYELNNSFEWQVAKEQHDGFEYLRIRLYSPVAVEIQFEALLREGQGFMVKWNGSPTELESFSIVRPQYKAGNRRAEIEP